MYHGTSVVNACSIAEQGFILSPLDVFIEKFKRDREEYPDSNFAGKTDEDIEQEALEIILSSYSGREVEYRGKSIALTFSLDTSLSYATKHPTEGGIILGLELPFSRAPLCNTIIIPRRQSISSLVELHVLPAAMSCLATIKEKFSSYNHRYILK